MSGTFKRFRKSVSRLFRRCSCCSGASVHIASSVGQKPCVSSKPDPLKAKVLTTEGSDPSSISTVSQEGIDPKLTISSSTDKSGANRPGKSGANTATGPEAAPVAKDPTSNLPSPPVSSDDSIETIELKEIAATEEQITEDGTAKVEDTENIATTADTKQSPEVPDDTPTVEIPAARTAREESFETLTDIEETADAAQELRELTHEQMLNNMPLTHMVGYHNQTTIQSVYAGSQCTATALTAVGFHQHYHKMIDWTPAYLDALIMTGDQNHSLFRDVYQYSKNLDFRVALDEFPSTIRLAFGVLPALLVNVGENSGLLFLSQTSETKQLGQPCLKDHFERVTQDLPEASFVITIGSYSHGIVKDDANRGWFIFDSHGSLGFPPPIYEYKYENADSDNQNRRGATLTHLDSLDTLITVLQWNYQPGTPCEARMIQVICEDPGDERDEEKSRQPSRVSVSHLVSQSVTARSHSRTSTAPRMVDVAEVDDVPAEDVINLE